MTQATVDVGAAVLKDVERHSSFISAALMGSVIADFAACFESEAHVSASPLPDAYHALIDAALNLKQVLLATDEDKRGKARLAYWSVLGLVFDVKAMMAAPATDASP